MIHNGGGRLAKTDIFKPFRVRRHGIHAAQFRLFKPRGCEELARGVGELGGGKGRG